MRWFIWLSQLFYLLLLLHFQLTSSSSSSFSSSLALLCSQVQSSALLQFKHLFLFQSLLHSCVIILIQRWSLGRWALISAHGMGLRVIGWGGTWLALTSIVAGFMAPSLQTLASFFSLTYNIWTLLSTTSLFRQFHLDLVNLLGWHILTFQALGFLAKSLLNYPTSPNWPH